MCRVFELSVTNHDYEPCTLIEVCRAWRQAVLSMPFIWAHVKFSFSSARGLRTFSRFIDQILPRAGGSPLNLILSAEFGCPSGPFHQVLSSISGRCRHIKIKASIPNFQFLLRSHLDLKLATSVSFEVPPFQAQRLSKPDPCDFEISDLRMPALMSLRFEVPLSFRVLPSSTTLRHLDLTNQLFDESYNAISFLRACPSVENFRLEVENLCPKDLDSSPLYHRNLHSLHIETFQALSWLHSLEACNLENITFGETTMKSRGSSMDLQARSAIASAFYNHVISTSPLIKYCVVAPRMPLPNLEAMPSLEALSIRINSEKSDALKDYAGRHSGTALSSLRCIQIMLRTVTGHGVDVVFANVGEFLGKFPNVICRFRISTAGANPNNDDVLKWTQETQNLGQSYPHRVFFLVPHHSCPHELSEWEDCIRTVNCRDKWNWAVNEEASQ